MNTPKTILVTGGSGYLASHIIQQLLKAGHTVHTTVRNARNPEKTRHLLNLAGHAGSLKLFEADLLKEGSFDEAMQGCHTVIHTASPFIINGFKDAKTALIDPAVQGTRNVLSAVNRTSTVRRVVLTSSVAAMYGDNQDAQSLPHQTVTEQHWNTTSTLTHQPYSLSKTLAEQAAWEMVKEQKRWDLVVINPSMIYGPSLTGNSDSTSLDTFRQLLDGTLKMGAPALTTGVVDVRDVAGAHIQAALNPHANGRYILSATELSLLDLARILKKHTPNPQNLPNRELPKALLWLAAPTVGLTRKFVARNIKWPIKLDHSRSIRDLNVTYRNIEDTLRDQLNHPTQDTPAPQPSKQPAR